MIEIILYIVVVIFVVMWCYFEWQQRPFKKLAAIMPGPTAYPIIGVGYQFIGSTSQRKKYRNIFLRNKLNVTPMCIILCFLEIMNRIIEYVKDYDVEPFRVWLGPYFTVIITKPEDLQVLTFLKQLVQTY